MNEHQLTLILGGARSGKSTFAQRLADASGKRVLFVATAEPGDEEMKARIEKHRADRPSNWQTIEEPRELARALKEGPTAPIVVVDCVTLWVSNLLLMPDASWEAAGRELETLLAWYRTRTVELIVVSNEVGLGLVPADELSRTYRDWLGWFNQRLAAEADAVYLMIAGLPIELKALVAAQGDVGAFS